MKVEIPSAAVDAAAALSTTGRQNDAWYRARMEDMLRAAVPHLFAVWSEALTSDEAIEAACKGEWGEEFPNYPDVHPEKERAWKRRALAAALSSVSGKDEQNG